MWQLAYMIVPLLLAVGIVLGKYSNLLFHRDFYAFLSRNFLCERGQAVQLRNFVRRTQPHSFITIFNSSEIIGKGFRGLN